MLFQYLATSGGRHQEGEQTYAPGDVVPSARDLAAIFPDRFKPVTSQEQFDQDKAAEAAKLASDPGGLGDDVTDQFEQAAAKGLLVRKTHTGWFNVFSEDDPAKKLNDKAMRLEAATSFVNDWVEA